MGRSPKMPSTCCCSDPDEDLVLRLLEAMARDMTAFLLSSETAALRFVRYWPRFVFGLSIFTLGGGNREDRARRAGNL